MNGEVTVRAMTQADVDAVVALQPLAFPPPFDPELLWEADHLRRHLQVFPDGQFVAVHQGRIVASCSNTRIPEQLWQAHGSWSDTVGGPMLDSFDPEGTTLYGLDISVHPEHQGQGVGRKLYQARFRFVRQQGLLRYGTACRMPNFASGGEALGLSLEEFAQRVVQGATTDRTLTPLLRMGLRFESVIRDYMDDAESGNAAALLSWQPDSGIPTT